MAKQQHYDLLKQKAGVWNAWRREHRDVRPDLRHANLSGADLRYANLISADLSGANLSSAILHSAILKNAHLSGAYLSGADLSSAVLSGADLSGAYLSGAYLLNASLSSAYLNAAHLSFAHLNDAFLSGAHLNGADFNGADLSKAFLYGADLTRTDLSGADLSGANFSKAVFHRTVFAWVDVSLVKDLETARHQGPSSVDIHSVTLPSDEQTRLHFLRGVGFTETQIESLPSLLPPRPTEHQALYVSYASQDEAIAQQLHSDLRTKDIPCWFSPPELKPGDYFREELDKTIHTQEKLLLILSKHSVESHWVKDEVTRARNREIEQDCTILYPIRLDDAVLTSTSGWAADLRDHRPIGDFTGWREDAAYQKAFSALLQHLKVNKLPTI